MTSLDELIQNGTISGLALEELRSLEARSRILKQINRDSTEAIIVTDATQEQTIVEVNQAFLDLYKERQKQLMSEKSSDKVPFAKVSTSRDFSYDETKMRIRPRKDTDPYYN